MAYIKLTLKNGNPVLVNSAMVTCIVPEAQRSLVYFPKGTEDEDRIAVNESLADIEKLLGMRNA